MTTRLRSVPAVVPGQQMEPATSGWFWDGSRWVCDPCDSVTMAPCPPPGFPTPCPPWFPPPAGQAPWYPGANGGVSFSQDPPPNPTRGNFWWDGVMLRLFDGAAWVNIGPNAGGGGGAVVGPIAPSNPITGQLWFDGEVLWIWNGSVWVVTDETRSFVQATAPLNPNVGDTWWDGARQWIWDGTAWQLIGGSGGSQPGPGPSSITPINLPWSAVIVPDFSQFTNSYTTLTGNFILGAPINTSKVLGRRGVMKLSQDVVGNRTMLVSTGWYFLGRTAPVLSTGANAHDLLHYYVDETGIVFGELHVDFASAPITPTPPTPTTIGNMTMNGGIAAAFDGNNTKTQAQSARLSFTGAGPTMLSGYVGKSYQPTGMKVLSATYYPPTDGSGAWGNTGGGPGSQYQLTINLRGSTGATPPANSAAGTLLFTQAFPITSPSITPMTTPLSMVPNDQATSYNFVWVEVVQNYTGTAAGTEDVFCAQLVLDLHP